MNHLEFKIGELEVTQYLQLFSPSTSSEKLNPYSAKAEQFISAICSQDTANRHQALLEYLKTNLTTPLDPKLYKDIKNIVNKILQNEPENKVLLVVKEIFKKLKHEVLQNQANAIPGDFIFISADEKAQCSIRNGFLQHVFHQINATKTTLSMLMRNLYQSDRFSKYLNEEDNTPSKYYPTIEHLLNNQGYQLKSSHINAVIDFLQKIYPGEFDCVHEAYTLPSVSIEDRKPLKLIKERLEEYQNPSKLWKKQRFLFIPFTYTNHIVLIGIDFRLKCIMHYDSQGFLCEDPYRKDYPNFDLKKELEEGYKLCFPEVDKIEILQNDRIHQSCHHNCGIYVLDCMERLLNGESFEQICLKGKGPEEIELARDYFAIRMIKINNV